MAEAEHVRALERGLAIMQAFSAARPSMTVADAAAATGLTRATARRFLHTLERLEFVRSDGRGFTLTPRAMSIGYAYLSSLGVGPVATPRIQVLSSELNESVTIATLHGSEYVVVARAESSRVLSSPDAVGATRPAHPSSIGKLLLANLPADELDAYFERTDLKRYTAHTITDEPALRAELETIRRQDWAVSDEELEEGLLSIAVPLRRGDNTVAAMNVTSHIARKDIAGLVDGVLPRLREAAKSISADLRYTTL